jgi:hypothetical protein
MTLLPAWFAWMTFMVFRAFMLAAFMVFLFMLPALVALVLFLGAMVARMRLDSNGSKHQSESSLKPKWLRIRST